MTKQERTAAVNLLSQTALHISDCNLVDASRLYFEVVCNAQFACNLGLITPVSFDIIVYRAKVFLDEAKASSIKK